MKRTNLLFVVITLLLVGAFISLKKDFKKKIGLSSSGKGRQDKSRLMKNTRSNGNKTVNGDPSIKCNLTNEGAFSSLFSKDRSNEIANYNLNKIGSDFISEKVILKNGDSITATSGTCVFSLSINLNSQQFSEDNVLYAKKMLRLKIYASPEDKRLLSLQNLLERIDLNHTTGEINLKCQLPSICSAKFTENSVEIFLSSTI
jgi:hypothetical protein